MRLVTLIVLAAVIVASAAAQARTSVPASRLVDRDPLTVVGTGFKPRERGVMTARGDMEPARVHVIATRAGRFRAKLNIAFDPCTGPDVIRAAGVKGSIAHSSSLRRVDRDDRRVARRRVCRIEVRCAPTRARRVGERVRCLRPGDCRPLPGRAAVVGPPDPRAGRTP